MPVKIFEDDNTVYITSEYQYELTGVTKETGRTYFADCQIAQNSLELLRDPDYYQEKWEMVVRDIHGDEELDAFIKERYGSSCSLKEKVTSGQDGVYDISIQGDGKDMSETSCLLNYGTVVKYYPVANKVVAWDTGQAPTFSADINNETIYDQEMVDSFRFLTDVIAETAFDTADYDYSSWQTFSNEQVGYWLMLPGVAEVVSPDPSQRVFFIGPEVNGRPQFQFGVDHYDSSLPDGTAFFQQVTEDYLSYLETVGRSDEGEVEELLIAGEPAIRLRHPGTIEADQPRDDFFFIHGDKIYQISITLFDGVEDEILNNQFLQSMTFMW